MALITNAEEFKAHLPAASQLENLPSFDAAENEYLIPILGNDLYQELSEAYVGEVLTPSELQLIDKCRAVIVPFAVVSDVALTQVLFTDSGLKAMDNEGSRKPFKWEYNNAVDALNMRGYAAQEMLILFLKKNADLFPTWSTSDYNDPEGFMLVRDGGDLRGLLRLMEPQRCYALLKPLFNVVAEEFLIPNLGDTFYATINNHLLNSTVTNDEGAVIGKLRMAAVRKVMSKAAVELNMKFGGKGFTIVEGRVKDSASEGEQAAGDTPLQRFINENEKSAALLMGKVVAKLNKDASVTVYPDWFSSSLYRDPTATSKPVDNTKFKGVFGA